MDIEKNLSREYILSLPAGREMDILIAENVLGWTGKKTVYTWSDRAKKERPITIFDSGGQSIGDFSAFVDEQGQKIYCGKPHKVYHPRPWSTDISAAFEAVEKSKKYPLLEAMTRNNKGVSTWRVTIGNVHVYEATVPLAICRALLLAVIGT